MLESSCASFINMLVPFQLSMSPGSVFEKKLTGARLIFFVSEIFDILIYLGLEKSLLFFWV